MTADLLLENFDVIAAAPGGIDRMRELVLQLAVCGKLVPQDAADESAESLLVRLQQASDGARKKARSGVENPRHDIPSTWVWTRLGELGRIVGGGTPKTKMPTYWADKGVPWLTPADLRGLKGKWISSGTRDISAEGLANSSAQLLPEGSVLFSSRAPIGYVALAKRPLATNQGFKSVVPYLLELNQFLYWFLNAVAPEVDRGASGTTFREVSGKVVSGIAVPLPPLAEQRRIVEKVDQLMALCDELDARQERLGEKRSRLTRSSLHHLGAAQEAADADGHWARFSPRIHELITAPEDVHELRQAVLQLAVRGKLVPQEATDEPVTEVLKHIEAEKERLRQDAVIPQRRGTKTRKPAEALHPVPNGWLWTRFEAASINRDATRVPLSRDERSGRSGAYPYYGASGIIDHIDDYLFDKPLLLIGEDGANLILRSTPIAFVADGRYWVNNHAHVIDALDREMLRYLAIAINATDLQPYLTGTAQPKLNQARLNLIPVPLPPLPEQRRIAEKVDQLMTLCDELEAKLTCSREKAERLSASIVHHMTAA